MVRALELSEGNMESLIEYLFRWNKMKVKVLIVLILVLVAFSTPVLANGQEGECEYPSDSEEGKIPRKPPHGERGEVSSDELEEITPPSAVPAAPPTPAEEPLSDAEITAVVLGALFAAGVFGRDEIMDVIRALSEWNSSGRPGGKAGLRDMINRKKPAETVTTQSVSITPGEKSKETEKSAVPTQRDYVEEKIKGDQDYRDAVKKVREARVRVYEARNNLSKRKQELSDFVNLTDARYKGPQLPEYEERVKEAKEALAAAKKAQDAALRALYDKKQELQLFYRDKYREEFKHSK